EFTVFVDYGEDEIDFVDLDLEGGDGLVDLWAIRSGLTCGRSLVGRSLGGSLRRRRGRLLLSGGGGCRGAGWRRRGCRGGCRAGRGLGDFDGGRGDDGATGRGE